MRRVINTADNKEMTRMLRSMERAYSGDDYVTFAQSFNRFVEIGEKLEKELLPAHEERQRKAHAERIKPKKKKAPDVAAPEAKPTPTNTEGEDHAE